MSTRSYCLRLCTSLAALLLAACGDDPQIPTAAVPVSTEALSERVGVVLQNVPTVRITDQKGKNIKGLLVRWRVTSGGGRVVNDTARTDGSGVATSGGWFLGTSAGTQLLQASADGIGPVTFTAQATPGPLTSLLVRGSNTVSAPVATPLSVLPVVRAEDQYGNGIPGLPVTFAVVQGNGSITGASQVTNADGNASPGSWTIGTIAGLQRLTATAIDAGVGTSASVSLNVTAQPGPAVSLVKLAGDNQRGSFNAAVGVPPGVRVIDQFGNGVGNVVVTFTPGANSGVVQSGTTSSDPANGSAFVGAWTLGTAETQTLIATAAAVPNASATFTATASASQFDLDVRFIGATPSPAIRQAFQTAIAKWRTVIVGDLHRTSINHPAGLCEDLVPAINEIINDVVIFARVDSIDGAGDTNGNILGLAGPCFVNEDTRLPSYSLMVFDSADVSGLVADGSITDVIIHEMGHALGIGSLWNFERGFLIGSGGSDPYFIGAGARTQFSALNTLTYSGNPVPVENMGGQGTQDTHWRESILGNELMTGFLNPGRNPLSRITAASLQDLGYVVNIAAADGFSFRVALYSFPFNVGTNGRAMHNDIRPLPQYKTDAGGRMRRVGGAL
jgi:hypothetical protein